MSMNRKALRRLILEELERISELEEFAGSKSGKSFAKEGARLQSSASKLFELGSDQTGAMGRTIKEVAQFVQKVGEGIAGINDLSEGDTGSRMPTVQEYKSVLKSIKKLER